MNATSNESLVVLARKSGTWLEWAEACRQLRKDGTPPQALFETTGFEVQLQERLLASFQVYLSLVEGGADEKLLTDIKQLGVQPLYELRVLNREERRAAAQLVAERRYSATQTRELVRAVRELFRMTSQPEAFERTAADALAYRCWRLADGAASQTDRITLASQGLAAVPSEKARRALESLLVQSVQARRALPRLPLAVPDSEDTVPRMVPVLVAPFSTADFEALAAVQPRGSFGLVEPAGQTLAVLPGWPAVSQAEDPVAIVLDGQELSDFQVGDGEVFLLVDRAARNWDEPACYAVDTEDGIRFLWIDAPSESVLLGRVVLVLRPPGGALLPVDPEDLWDLDE